MCFTILKAIQKAIQPNDVNGNGEPYDLDLVCEESNRVRLETPPARYQNEINVGLKEFFVPKMDWERIPSCEPCDAE